jgi:hypothetical protein
MSLARKCDICGCLYENYSSNKTKGKDANGISFVDILDNQKMVIKFTYDCCPQCMKDVQKLVEVLKGDK